VIVIVRSKIYEKLEGWKDGRIPPLTFPSSILPYKKCKHIWGKYAYLVPFVETENEIFLKTIIPSRKATRRYLRGKKDDS